MLAILMPGAACLAAPDATDAAAPHMQWYRSNKPTQDYPPAVAKLAGEGIAFMNQGKWDAAIEKFDAALKLMPDAASLYQNRGMCHMGAEQWDAALADFNHALALDPDMAGILYWNRADCYKAMNKPELAVADYTRSLALNPEPKQRATMQLARGRLLVDLGDAEQAEQDFRQVTKFPPLRAPAYSELAYLATLRRDARACIALASRAIEANPDFSDGWLNRSTCELTTGKFDAALNDLNNTIRLDPDRPEAYVNRAAAHAARHECRAAHDDAEKAAQFAPAYGDVARKLVADCR